MAGNESERQKLLDAFYDVMFPVIKNTNPNLDTLVADVDTRYSSILYLNCYSVILIDGESLFFCLPKGTCWLKYRPFINQNLQFFTTEELITLELKYG